MVSTVFFSYLPLPHAYSSPTNLNTPYEVRPRCLAHPHCLPCCVPPVVAPPPIPVSFIGRAYAKVILGLLKDVLEPTGSGRVRGDASQPVYVVEVGAGHGRFGYLVIEALLQLRPFLPKATT